MKNTLQQPKVRTIIKNIPPDAARIWHDGGEWIVENAEGQCWNKKITCPYQPGDRIWVRKAWQLVVSVKAERLQDISEEDAKSEGVRPFMGSPLPYKAAFCTLWQHINGPESWVANPWVWVVEFKKI